MRFLDNLNDHVTADVLNHMLSTLKERPIPTRKADRAQRLYQIWVEEPGRILEKLSDTERLLLSDMVHHDHTYLDLKRFHARYGQRWSWPSRYGGKGCLIFCFFGAEDRGPPELVKEVCAHLKSVLPPPPPLVLESHKVLPTTGRWRREPSWSGDERNIHRDLTGLETERTAQIELRRVLQLAAAGKLKVSPATGYPTATTVKHVDAVLATLDMDLQKPQTSENTPFRSPEPGPVRAFAWPVLIQQCGWAQSRKGTLVLTAKGKRMLTGFDPEEFCKGITAWVENKTFDEMRRVSAVKGQTSKLASRLRVPPAIRRHSIMATLEILPANEWVEIEEAYRGLLAIDGDCRVVQDGYCLYMGNPQYGALGSHNTFLGRIYFRQVLGESLATLGLVDIGYAAPHHLHPELYASWGADGETYTCRYDGLKFIRLTPLGRYCIGVKNAYTSPPLEEQSILTVLPNLEIAVTDPAAFSAADAAQLSSFAGHVSDAVWRLDRRHLLEALERGDTVDHIQEVLASLARNEVPDTVRRFIEETAARAHAALSTEDAMLVHFVDEHTAALVCSDTAAGKAALGRHGCAVVVPQKRIRAFSSALKKMGILLPA